jgi:hypothetical protein
VLSLELTNYEASPPDSFNCIIIKRGLNNNGDPEPTHLTCNLGMICNPTYIKYVVVIESYQEGEDLLIRKSEVLWPETATPLSTKLTTHRSVTTVTN